MFRAHLIKSTKFLVVAWLLDAILLGGHWELFLDERQMLMILALSPDTCRNPYVWRSIQILPGLCGILTVPVGQALSLWHLGAGGPAGSLAQT